MRNYKQVDTQETEERVRIMDVIGAMLAIAGVTVLIWGLI